MNKGLLAAFLLCAMCISAGVKADETGKNDGTEIRTEHYLILCNEEDGRTLADEMEERFSVYNRLFRFYSNNASGPADNPMVVMVINDTETFNGYLNSQIDFPYSSNSGAVYLHYNQNEGRKLIIDRSSGEAGANLPYLAFIQYLRGKVSNPPAWITYGFGVYFSSLNYSDGRLSYEENPDWLEKIKELKNLPPVEDILTADSSALTDDYPGLAWSLVSFFLNSGNDEYKRTLTDCFMLLSDSVPAEENTKILMERIARWNNMETLAADYRHYLDSRKTWTWLMEEGQRAYAAQDWTGAQFAFMAARNQKPSHFAPWYFLGLLAYEESRFDDAEQFYLKGLQLGADPALTAYALGLNAARAGRRTDAEKYLYEAARIAPERYKEKAENVLSQLY